MAERSFKSEVAKLRLGAGQEFRGEGILAVTKALLQSGVSYVSGYQGAPISHLVDVLADADDVLRELGIRFRRARTRRRPPRRLQRPSIIRCAARQHSSRRSAPTSPPTRSPTSPRAASPAAR